jgi:uncharacterized protein
VNGTFESSGLRLARHLALPSARTDERPPGVIICHGFPTGPLDARQSALTFPELCDRAAHERGWIAMTFTFRGCGDSEGDFSLGGWADDLRAAVDHLEVEAAPSSVFLVGTSTGGSLALCHAATDMRIGGVATLGAPASFDDWVQHPRRLLERARELGAIRRTDFPARFETWSSEFARFNPTDAARRLSPRPLLVLHGDEDDEVADVSARILANAHGSAELRLIDGGGMRLRHDPRAVAILLGWLDRIPR